MKSRDEITDPWGTPARTAWQVDATWRLCTRRRAQGDDRANGRNRVVVQLTIASSDGGTDGRSQVMVLR